MRSMYIKYGWKFVSVLSKDGKLYRTYNKPTKSSIHRIETYYSQFGLTDLGKRRKNK